MTTTGRLILRNALILVLGCVVGSGVGVRVGQVQAAAEERGCGLRAVAHRGAHDIVDENTVASIKRANRLGAFVELDVRVVQGRWLYLMHDRTVDRTTDGHGPIEKMTRAEVERLRTDRGQQVPTLQEAIGALAPGQKAVIEGKSYQDYWVGHPALFRQVQRAVVARDKVRQVFMGGTRGYLNGLETWAPRVRAFWRPGIGDRPNPKQARLRSADLVLPFVREVSARQVRVLRRAGHPVWARLAHLKSSWRLARRKGMTAVTVNDPALFRVWCRRHDLTAIRDDDRGRQGLRGTREGVWEAER